MKHRGFVASILAASLAASFALAITLVGTTPAMGQVRSHTASLNGVGSSADAPLLAAANPHYSGATVNYSALGSGTGQTDMNAGPNWDFGAWDVPQGIPGDSFGDQSKLTQLPITAFGVAIITNLPHNIQNHLKLTGSILGDIYTGKVKTWGAKEIVKLNPQLKKNTTAITPIVRSDKSGTTFAFTDFLCRTSSAFKAMFTNATTHFCPSKAPTWTWTGGLHSSGVDLAVKGTVGAVGYVETTYTFPNHEIAAAIQNKAKQFVHPREPNIAADANQAKHFSSTTFSVSNEGGKNSYPITTFSWVGVYTKGSQGWDPSNCAATKAYLTWLISSKGGQKYASPLAYVPLPKTETKYATNALKSVAC